MPGTLEDGRISPVEALTDKPAGALKTPPVSPVRITGLPVVMVVQNGPSYRIDANGDARMVTGAVTFTSLQSPIGGMVYTTM
jgi:hypothetical protein